MEREQLEKGLDALLFIDNINGPRTFLRRYASAGSSDRNVSVRSSVRLSRAGIVSKRRKLAA